MKRILFILINLPFFILAQSNNANANKLPLIESITSDTVNGKFNQLFFSYDQSNRVVGITKKEIIISTNSDKTNTGVEQITEKQDFDYKGIAIEPFSRKLVSFEFDEKSKKWNVTTNEQTYFLYENGKRAADSTLYYDPESKAIKLINISKLDRGNARIELRKDLSIPFDQPGGAYNIYLLTLDLDDSTLNTSYESSEHFYGNAGRDRTVYKFSKYDQMINPLQQLNIANSLCIEKLSLTAEGRYGETSFSWYFVNQNNVLNLKINTLDFSSPFDETYSISYSYNQFKQPIHAKACVKQEIRRMGMPYKTYQKSFTFRYK
ncbi:MAG: hypothetical protein WCP74_05935 [Sphingobacteriia bacterium]|jgi:hypothetical protein